MEVAVLAISIWYRCAILGDKHRLLHLHLIAELAAMQYLHNSRLPMPTLFSAHHRPALLFPSDSAACRRKSPAL